LIDLFTKLPVAELGALELEASSLNIPVIHTIYSF